MSERDLYRAMQANERANRRRQSVRAVLTLCVLIAIAIALYFWGQAINNR